jgi:hypothetical protein
MLTNLGQRDEPCSEHNDTCRSGREPFLNRFSVIASIFVGAALVVVGLLQFGVYSRQAKIMKTQTTLVGEQARIATDANKLTRAIQRAFVHFEKVDWHYVEKEQYTTFMPMAMPGHGLNKRKVVEITIWLTNTGNTPTSTLLIDIICPKPDHKVDEPFSLFSWDQGRAIQQVIGPKQTVEIGPCDNLSPQDVGANAAGFVPRYVIGEIRYRDTVEAERDRRTQFALQLRFFNEDLDTLKGRAVAVGKHNCTDDNCPP